MQQNLILVERCNKMLARIIPLPPFYEDSDYPQIAVVQYLKERGLRTHVGFNQSLDRHIEPETQVLQHLNCITCNFSDAVPERREDNGKGLQPGPAQPGTFPFIRIILRNLPLFHLDVKVSFEGFPPLSATLASGVKYNTLPCRYSSTTQ